MGGVLVRKTRSGTWDTLELDGNDVGSAYPGAKAEHVVDEVKRSLESKVKAIAW